MKQEKRNNAHNSQTLIKAISCGPGETNLSTDV